MGYMTKLDNFLIHLLVVEFLVLAAFAIVHINKQTRDYQYLLTCDIDANCTIAWRPNE